MVCKRRLSLSLTYIHFHKHFHEISELLMKENVLMEFSLVLVMASHVEINTYSCFLPENVQAAYDPI